MARFTIYSPTGTALYTGTPTFTGQYMKPGFLEFREVALALLVELVPGCYVDYTRTGRRYKIYTAPQLKKQARPSSYGGAFVYQSVQLYDASKMLEYCPFRDLVLGDNRIHFSTQPSISTFEGCDGLARRFEACLVDQYGAGSWQVRIATAEENPALHDLMLEPREFTVSGLNILECLDKIYEIWPGVGWLYTVENSVDTIVIGGGGANPNVGTYAYGKGNGLTSLTRVAANADEIANRIFAYGSSRNMVLPSWYRNQDIKDAESVDIQNLMLPIGPVGTPGTPDYWPGWGETDGERDAAKAFVENAASILKNGLRPATVYFDGKGKYPEIYPSIRETTIGMVRTAIGDSTAKYYPSTTIYTDPDARIDKLLSAQSAFDSGKQSTDGKSAVATDHADISETGSGTAPAGSQHNEVIFEETATVTEAGTMSISATASLEGSVTAQVYSVVLTVLISVNGNAVDVRSEELENNNGQWVLHAVAVGSQKIALSVGDTVTCTAYIQVVNFDSATAASYSYSASGNYSMKMSLYREKTFRVSLRQVGFDIGAQAALGNGKTIAMRSGDCVGRSFAIKSAQYDSANDCWVLECWRTEDESLSQWFPNTDYPVRGLENAGQSNEYPGDEFVLLDIAMPDIYIAMASQKLLVAARELLADSAVERWQYNPEIDAKYMVENARTINAGEAMTISDPDIIGVNPESVIVDTITISEGESPIPTYKVTLRDRKKKTWTESAMPETSSSKSVGSTSETVQPTSTGGDSFFQLDESGNVTLKSQYRNLWVPGWLAAGGIGQGGSGGGGLITSVKGVADLNTPIASESLTETFSAYAIQSIYNSVRLKSAVALSNVLPYASGRVRVATLTIDGTNHDIYAPEPTGGGGVETETDPIFSASAAFGISTTDIANWNAKYDKPSGGIPKTDLASAVQTSLGKADTALQSETDPVYSAWIGTSRTKNTVLAAPSSANGTPSFRALVASDIPSLTISKISDAETWISGKGYALNSDLTSLAGRVTGIEDWFEIVTVNGQSTLHVKQGRALYSDSWIAAGGIGSGGGGGGGSFVAWGTKSGYTRPLTVEGVTETLLLDGALAGYATTAAMNAALAGKQNTLAFTLQGTSGATYNLANALYGAVISSGADIGTTLTTIATVAGVDIKAKITHQSLSGYATQTWVNNQGFIKTEADPTVPAWAKESSKPSYSLSEISGTSDLRAIEALIGTGFLKRTGTNTWALDTNSYLPLTGGSVTGAVEFLGSLAGPIESGTTRYWRIDNDGTAVFDSVSILGLQVGGNAIDFDNYVTRTGAQTITGDKTFTGFLYGDENPDTHDYYWRIDDDGTAAFGTLHVGGVSVVPANYVTLSGAQTISGVKTFSGGIVMDGADVIPSADLGSQLGYSNRRFSNVNARTLAVNEINFKNSNNNARTGYLSFADGYMNLCSGANIDSSNKQIIFHETYGLYPENGNSINLGYYSSTDNRYRWANIYGVNADLSGNLSLASSSHIDIGPLRIEYDATNKALHITKASSSDTNNYGIYADGFVAAGGIGQTS